MKDCKNVLSDRLNELIEECKDMDHTLSETKQAKQIGIPYQTFHKYVIGSAECSIGNLVKIAKHYKVSTDYLLGLSPNKTTDPDINNACELTGLDEHSIIKISKADCESKNVLDSFIQFEGFNEILEYLKRISITVTDKNVFNFIYSDIWNELESNSGLDIDFLQGQCDSFIYYKYCNYPYTPLQEIDTIYYNDEIDLNHFKITKLFSEFVNQLVNKEITKTKKENIINELNTEIQDYINRKELFYQEIEEKFTTDEADKADCELNKMKKSFIQLIKLLESTL